MNNDLQILLERWLKRGLGTPLLVIMMLAMMILPLPSLLLDFLFTFNIAFSLIVLLSGIYAKRPLDFAVFPTVLLLATLLRLSLNVASTRVVLLDGHTGTDAAGRVIEAFGEVVIGGNYTVGLVVFAVLVVINFVVVTKGAGRVSEVSARFTLDAMPGKQMAIDADLNAGIIDQKEAKRRREEVVQEADFYGSMDGASKFVRGDAVAGILILLINIVGGLIIGVAQHNMSFSSAFHNYVLLTVGDGLVAQIPSLILSTAAAIMVTRVSSAQDMSGAVANQVFNNSRSLYISSAVIAALGIIPGMPHIAFLGIAGIIGGLAYYTVQQQQKSQRPDEPEAAELAVTQEADQPLNVADVATVDIIGLEVGYKLISLVDTQKNGPLLGRIKAIRRKLSQELGFLVPSVRVRDNLDLPPDHYKIYIAGVALGSGQIYSDKFLAINPGEVFSELEGTQTQDPAFGLQAVWINSTQQEFAQSQGYTVVDPSTVIATHLSKALNNNAALLLGHEETQQLLDNLAETAPKLVSELVPERITLGTLVGVLQNLLQEGVPIRDLRTIAETLATQSAKTSDLDALTGSVRANLGNMIVQSISELGSELPIMTLSPDLEQILQNTLEAQQTGQVAFEPSLAEKMQMSLRNLADKQSVSGEPSVLVVQPNLRQLLARFTRSFLPDLHVLSYHEIPDNHQIRIIGAVG